MCRNTTLMKLLVNIKEASELLSSSDKYIRVLIKVGILVPLYREKKMLIPIKQLEAFVNEYAGLDVGTEETLLKAKSIVERKQK